MQSISCEFSQHLAYIASRASFHHALTESLSLKTLSAVARCPVDGLDELGVEQVV